MKRFRLVSVCILNLFIFSNFGMAQMLIDITSDIETDFGTYHAYPVNINPCAESYAIGDNLQNVSNFDQFSAKFSEADLALLKNNYFVVKPTAYKEIFDIYKDCKEREIPVFVTTDALLHTFHIIYDYALRALEVQKFAADLVNLNKALLTKMELLYNDTEDDSLKAIVLKNVAYVGVATKLKDSTAVIPAFATELVDEELELITAHEGGH